MRFIATSIAFAGSCIMLGLMVSGPQDSSVSNFARQQGEFARVCILLTGLAFLICLIESFYKDYRGPDLPKKL